MEPNVAAGSTSIEVATGYDEDETTSSLTADGTALEPVDSELLSAISTSSSSTIRLGCSSAIKSTESDAALVSSLGSNVFSMDSDISLTNSALSSANLRAESDIESTTSFVLSVIASVVFFTSFSAFAANSRNGLSVSFLEGSVLSVLFDFLGSFFPFASSCFPFLSLDLDLSLSRWNQEAT